MRIISSWEWYQDQWEDIDEFFHLQERKKRLEKKLEDTQSNLRITTENKAQRTLGKLKIRVENEINSLDSKIEKLRKKLEE